MEIKIKIKYKLGSAVYAMHFNKIERFIITQIKYDGTFTFPDKEYGPNVNYICHPLLEDGRWQSNASTFKDTELFTTKAALLKSL